VNATAMQSSAPAFLVIDCPFAGGDTDAECPEYYRQNNVSWPWVKLADRAAVDAAIKHPYYLGSSCPMLELVKGDEFPGVSVARTPGLRRRLRAEFLAQLRRLPKREEDGQPSSQTRLSPGYVKTS